MSQGKRSAPQDWKQVLFDLRAGLPPYREPIPIKRGATGRDRGLLEKEYLIALCDRQEWLCFWCGLRMTADDPQARSYRTLEHVIPRCSGHPDISLMSNFRASCKGCNEMRAEIQHIGDLVRDRDRLKRMLTEAQKVLGRHRITMSGRCYYCKARFHIREWWLRFKDWRSRSSR
jgi:hypothetical protein